MFNKVKILVFIVGIILIATVAGAETLNFSWTALNDPNVTHCRLYHNNTEIATLAVVETTYAYTAEEVSGRYSIAPLHIDDDGTYVFTCIGARSAEIWHGNVAGESVSINPIAEVLIYDNFISFPARLWRKMLTDRILTTGNHTTPAQIFPTARRVKKRAVSRFVNE